MKKNLLVFVFFISIASFAQKKSKTLVTIDKEVTTVDDFKRIYEKNLDAIDNEESKNVSKNLELYINYKLKVKEAYRIKLDTLPSYKREMETYKNQLSAPYMQDTTYLTKLVKDAYFRTKYEIKAKHILIRLPRDATPKDTLMAYNKILKIRNRILKGDDFEKVAKEVSEDKSAQDNPKTGRKGNKGNLGYFSAFKMVYPFEEAAYTTKVGEISMPFKTRFGYHILKVDELRKSKGDIEVAHILIKNSTPNSKKIIDSVYNKLLNKENFKDLAINFSDDNGSKAKGGRLNKFGTGYMVKPFEEASFSLKKEGDFSKPFKTRFGWHIVKLIKKHPIKSFEKIEKQLRAKIKRSSRMQLSEKSIINKLKKKYAIIDNEKSKEILNKKNLRAIPKDSLQKTLFSINEKKIKQEKFINYIRNRRHLPVYTLFDMFKNAEVLAYYKENLIKTEPEYAYTLTEYKDGLLLFELMQRKIWNKSAKDSIGLKNYFNKNLTKYKTKELKKIKGQVMNDYQSFLENTWIADLRKKSSIKINKRELKRLIKYYQKK